MQSEPAHENLHTLQNGHLPLELSHTSLKKAYCKQLFMVTELFVTQITTNQIKRFFPLVPSEL